MVIMTLDDFRKTLEQNQPPKGLNTYLESLWLDAKDDWEKAHTVVQNLNTPEAAWIHAYLHRKEGDAFNAGYWYRRAGRAVFTESLEQEWEQLVRYFCNSYGGTHLRSQTFRGNPFCDSLELIK